MKPYIAYCLFFLFFCNEAFNRSIFAQEKGVELKGEETFQRYDSLEQEMFLARKPLIAFAYNNLKVFGGSRGSVMGYVSFNYLPTGLPGISETVNPLVQPTFGFGVKLLAGSFLYRFTSDFGRIAWYLPPEASAKTVSLASFNGGIDIGYAVWKTNDFFLIPCVSMGLSSYTFDTNSSWRIYTGRNSLGGAVDMSYFVPLAVSPFQSLEEKKLGIKEIIEAMISVRLGAAQHFDNRMPFLTAPTHQEFSMRIMLGIGTHKFVEDF
jgi:hypothetical protein